MAKTKRGAKKKTARKRSRAVVSRTQKKHTVKRTIKRKAPPKKKRRRRPEPPPMAEYQVSVSYRDKHRAGSAINFQFSVIAKPGLSRDEVIDAVTQVIESEGEDVPRGFKVRIVSWKDGPVPSETPWETLSIVAGEPATRFSVQ